MSLTAIADARVEKIANNLKERSQQTNGAAPAEPEKTPLDKAIDKHLTGNPSPEGNGGVAPGAAAAPAVTNGQALEKKGEETPSAEKKSEPAREVKAPVDTELDEHLKWLTGEEGAPEGTASGKKAEKAPDVDYQAKAKEYEDIVGDPTIKAFIDFRKSGGEDVNEFLSKIGAVDYNKMPEEQLLRSYAKDILGITDADELTQAVEEISGKSKIEKFQLINQIKAQFKQRQEEVAKNFSSTHAGKAEVHQRYVQSGVEELKNAQTAYVGKKFKGLLISPEMWKDIEGHVTDYAIYKQDEKGNFAGYDIQRSIGIAVWELYSKQLLRANYDLAMTKGMEKVLDERQRPSRNDVTETPAVAHSQTIGDAVKSLRNAKKGG